MPMYYVSRKRRVNKSVRQVMDRSGAEYESGRDENVKGADKNNYRDDKIRYKFIISSMD